MKKSQNKLQEIFGWHAVMAALESKTTVVTRVYIANTRGGDSRHQKVCALSKQLGITVEMTSREAMDQRWGRDHQGVAAESNYNAAMMAFTEDDLDELLNPTQEENSELERVIDPLDALPKLILILDGIQDPHNLGACMRSAGAAHVSCVIAPKDKSTSLTPAARKVACGAAETVPFIQVTNLVRTMKKLQEMGVWIYGLDQDAERSIYETKFSGNIAIVMGAEEHGIRRLTGETCDDIIKIPMLGEMESLNVSVAAGITMFHIRHSAG